jgi:hypothetical protein
LNDCQSYLFCGSSATGDPVYEVTSQRCPEGHVFDPNSAIYCTRSNAASSCVQYQCDEKNTRFTYVQLSYGINRQFYALCVPNIPNPRIFTCPGNTTPNLSSFPSKCDYRCLRIGNFENTLDSTKYFECSYNGFLRLESGERSCPPRTTFNPSRSRCEVSARSLSEAVENV